MPETPNPPIQPQLEPRLDRVMERLKDLGGKPKELGQRARNKLEALRDRTIQEPREVLEEIVEVPAQVALEHKRMYYKVPKKQSADMGEGLPAETIVVETGPKKGGIESVVREIIIHSFVFQSNLSWNFYNFF